MSLKDLFSAYNPESRRSAGNPLQVALLCVLLCAVVFMLYYQVKDFEFITFDDPLYVVENKHVQSGLTVESIKWAFHFIQEGDNSYWHPLAWFSHMLDYELFGLKAGMHHVSNVVHHLVCSILLFISLWLFTRSTWRSFFVSLLFAIHPVNVDSVAWIAERKNLLSSCFWMITLICYYFYARKPNVVRYLGFAIPFVLGILTKPMLVTLPFVMLLVDFWPMNRIKALDEGKSIIQAVFSRNTLYLVLEKVPLFVISVAAIAINSQAVRNIQYQRTAKGISLLLRLENAFVSYLLYMKKLVWPTDLTFYYPFPKYIPLWEALASLACIILITVVALRAVKKYPYVLFGWLWFTGTMVPVSGIMQGGLWPQIAERWAYIPYIGLFIIVSWGLWDLVKRFPAREFVGAALALAIMVPLAAKAYVQTGYWKNNFSLYEHAIRINDGNYVAHLNLGIALAEKGKIDEAILHYKTSLAINPRVENTYYAMGMAYHAQKKPREAIPYFEQALKIKPSFVPAHVKLGMIYIEQKRMDDAIQHLRAVAELDPFDSDALLQLGLALSVQGDQEGAVKNIRRAVMIDPKDSRAFLELGKIYVMTGRFDEAEFEFSKALGLDPKNARGHYYMGLAKDANGKKESALRHINEALKIDPKEADYHTALGIVLAGMGRVDEAQANYSDAIKLKPDHADAHYYLGSVLLMKGKSDEAIGHIREAIRLSPENGNYRFGLGTVYASMGKLDEAEQELNEALRITPKSERIMKELGNIMMRKGKWDAAIELYQKVLSVNPNQSEVHNNLGTAFIHTGEISKAIRSYQDALKVKPDNADARKNLNMAQASQKKLEGTIQALLKEAKAQPGNPAAHIRLADVYRQYGSYEQALRHYQKAISLEKGNVRALYGLVLVYSDTGNYTKAIETLREILAIKPSDPNVYYNIACMYAKQRMNDEAIHWLDQSIQKGFNNWDMMRKDPDLAGLKNTAYMKNLMSGHAPSPGAKKM